MTSYMLFKNKRPVGNIKFDSYEKCRQWFRRLLRSKPYDPLVWDWSHDLYRTPSLKAYGYSIRRI